MIWAAIKADAVRLWRALTRDAVAELRREMQRRTDAQAQSIIGIHLLMESMLARERSLNDRIVALEIERAAAPPAEPEPDPATSWQRARARAEHG